MAVRSPVAELRPVACESVDRGDGALICDYCRAEMSTCTNRDHTKDMSPDAVPVCPGVQTEDVCLVAGGWLTPVACEPIDRGDTMKMCDYCRSEMPTKCSQTA